MLEVPASGVRAASVRMGVIAENLANAEATRTAQGGPYRRQVVQLASRPAADRWGGLTPGALANGQVLQEVSVQGIIPAPDATKKVYDPGHPDADAAGYVEMPNVDVPMEMADLTVASRVYQANLAALQSLRRALRDTVDLLG